MRHINSFRPAAIFVGFAVCTTAAFTSSRKSRTPILTASFNGAPRSTDGVSGGSQEEFSESISSSARPPRGQPVLDRRKAFAALSTLATGALIKGTVKPVNAFDRSFPDELTGTDRQPIVIAPGSRLSSQQRATAAAERAKANRSNLQNFNLENDLGPSLAWGTALWLLLGSRSNPLATPIANLLYDPKDEAWLRDRNDGLFAPLPFEFLFILSFVFGFLGFVTQFSLLQLAQGDSEVCLQLAGVTLIGGATLELGRIASGEKSATRDENDRSNQLQQEFAEFANARLTSGGNCHRRDIVAAFRRYFAKYRQADSEEYPLTDLEIEQLLRSWNRRENRGKAEMTSGGFYYGIQINKEADVFIS
jgi:hypothetical protein